MTYIVPCWEGSPLPNATLVTYLLYWKAKLIIILTFYCISLHSLGKIGWNYQGKTLQAALFLDVGGSYIELRRSEKEQTRTHD